MIEGKGIIEITTKSLQREIKAKVWVKRLNSSSVWVKEDAELKDVQKVIKFTTVRPVKCKIVITLREDALT